ncbi:MAG TPA: 50S ribosomal protein L6 [Thermoplasmata archaeon]
MTVPIPSGVTLVLHGTLLTAKGPLGSVTRVFPTGIITLSVKKGEAELKLEVPPKRRASKALLHTWESHVKNLTVGVTKGFEAKMKSVAAHFPMKVQVKDSSLVIENFLGEKHPRTANLIAGVTATVEGDFVVLSGNDIERVGQSAANIERATRIREYDPRVFQDGIYIIEKAHGKGGD